MCVTGRSLEHLFIDEINIFGLIVMVRIMIGKPSLVISQRVYEKIQELRQMVLGAMLTT